MHLGHKDLTNFGNLEVLILNLGDHLKKPHIVDRISQYISIKWFMLELTTDCQNFIFSEKMMAIFQNVS